MRKINFNLMIVALALSYIVVGCKKDDKKEDKKKVEENGLTTEINKIIPDSIVQTMISLGMPVNRGGNPPTITGTFMCKPFILKASNRPGDAVGSRFADYEVTFYDQDNDELTIKLDYVNGPESGSGLGSFIVGSGNNFSVFAEVISSSSGTKATLVNVLSGELMDDGIHNFHFANFMIDNQGNAQGIWIENGEGRILYDSDSISEITSGKKKAMFDTYKGCSASLSIK